MFSDDSAVPLSRKWLWIAALLIFLPWGMYSQTAREWKIMTADMKKLRDSHKEITNKLKAKTQLISAFEANKKHIETANNALVSDVRDTGSLANTHAENYDALEKREEALLGVIDELESHIQSNSQFAIKEDYGEGPYQVEVTLTAKTRTRASTLEPIVFELSPLNAMPHSVHHFLQMVQKELWNEMSFMPQQSARHRIHASPVEINTLNRMDWKFKDAKLSNLAFGEQTAPNSCGPYSVGFVGSPGGPDFYINGAFVPKAYAKQSCFAKVISGESTVDAIVDGTRSVVGIQSIRRLTHDDMISP